MIALLALPAAHAWELPHLLPPRQPVDTVGDVSASINADEALVEVYDRATGLRVHTRRMDGVDAVRVAADMRAVFVVQGATLGRWDLASDTLTRLPSGATEDTDEAPGVVLFDGVPAVETLPGGDVVALIGRRYGDTEVADLALARWTGSSPAAALPLERPGYAWVVGMQVVGEDVLVGWSDGTLRAIRGAVVTERRAPIEHLSIFRVSPDGAKVAWAGSSDQLVVTDRAGIELARSPRAPVVADGRSSDPAVRWLRWDAGGAGLSARWVDPEAGSPFGLEALDVSWDLASGRTTDVDVRSEDPLPGSPSPRRCGPWRVDGATLWLHCAERWEVDLRTQQLRLQERRDARWVKNELVGPGGVRALLPPEAAGVTRTTRLAAETGADGRYFSNPFEDEAADGTRSAYLLVWSGAGGEPVLKLPLPELPSETTWVGDRVLVTSAGHTRLYSAPDGRQLLDLRGTLSGRFGPADWSVAEDLLLGCAPEGTPECATYRLSDGARVAALETVPLSLPTQGAHPRFVGRDKDGSVCVEEVGRGCVAKLPTPEDSSDSWIFAPDGSVLLLEHRLGSEVSRFTLFDPQTGSRIRDTEAAPWVGFPAPGVVAFAGQDELDLLRMDGSSFRLGAVELEGVPHLVGMSSSGALIGDGVSLPRIHRGEPGALEFYRGGGRRGALRAFLAR